MTTVCLCWFLPCPRPPNASSCSHAKEKKTKNNDYLKGRSRKNTFKIRSWCEVYFVKSVRLTDGCCVSVAVPVSLITSSAVTPCPSCTGIWFPVTIGEVSVACWPSVPALRHRSRSVRSVQPHRNSLPWSRSAKLMHETCSRPLGAANLTCQRTAVTCSET